MIIDAPAARTALTGGTIAAGLFIFTAHIAMSIAMSGIILKATNALSERIKRDRAEPENER